MAARSRKKGRHAKAPSPRPAPAAATAAPATATPEEPPRRLRGEERNEAIRATLEPYAPGERPWSIRIAVLLAILIAGGDVIDLALGGSVRFGHAGKGGVYLFSAIMLVAAGGMWRMRYWAILGFQAILGIVVLLFSLALIRASNLSGLVIALVIVFGGGWLFFKLVRVLSRVQMPERRPAGDRARP